ncbi:MAG: di-heme oxidoredictase family protein, partial [Pseudomonadota bacterium]
MRVPGTCCRVVTAAVRHRQQPRVELDERKLQIGNVHIAWELVWLNQCGLCAARLVGTARFFGRYGHKATSASVLQQSADAYRGDLGVTSSVAPEESCGTNQASCTQAALIEP